MRTWCANNPERTPTAAVMGASLYRWSCRGSTPAIGGARYSPDEVDGLGYFIGPWVQLAWQ